VAYAVNLGKNSRVGYWSEKKRRALARNVPHINITTKRWENHRFKLLGRAMFKAPSKGTWSKL